MSLVRFTRAALTGALLTGALLTTAAGTCLAADASAARPKLKVALTFDDLPVNGPVPLGSSPSKIARETLAVFKKHRIPPSYGFINAAQLEGNPDGALALKLWVEAGHPLANHTYGHISLTQNTVEDFQREIKRNEAPLMLLATGKKGIADSWRWFRYPYLHEGNTLEKRNAVREFLQRNQYRIAQTSIDHEDYLWNTAHARCVVRKDDAAIAWLRESYLQVAEEYILADVEASRLAFGRDIHHVFLLHLGSFSAEILPDLFALLKKLNFEIVTLEEAHSDPIYSTDTQLVRDWGGIMQEQVLEARGQPFPKVNPKPRERLQNICK